MPDLNGAAATDIMKLLGRIPPVIALTGLGYEDIDLVRDKFTKKYHKSINAENGT
jgi:hypothetical protein